MNELIIKEKEKIENMIYKIRGVQVMLSSDVAKLYHVETKRINEVIKRNINRFPNAFCFQLTNDEIDKLSSRSQFATLNKSYNLRGYNIKYLPYALTEQGIMMLSGLLKSDIALLYGVETKRINEAVKNNPLKFPERYVIRISENEYCSLKSKISTSKGGSRKGHTAFKWIHL